MSFVTALLWLLGEDFGMAVLYFSIGMMLTEMD